MLKRKIICCASVLAIMLMLGWKLEQSIMPVTSVNQVNRISNGKPQFRSANFSEPTPVNNPFSPREYTRIRLTVD